MRVGLVDLDTSHPEHWVPILRDQGHEVVGVIDHGDVRAEGYAESFAEQHQIPRVFDSIVSMAEEVDLAILHGSDWDRHVERATPFVDAGCAVLVDKPVAGCSDDLDKFESWARDGVRITGGSSLRFCSGVQSYLSQPIDDRGVPHTALCGCAVDDFNYGIHAYSMLAGVFGGDAKTVRHVSKHGQRRLEVSWEDGRLGWLVIGEAADWQPFYATLVSDRGCQSIKETNADQLYTALLTGVLPYLAGNTDDPPLPIDQWLAPERWALAAKQSWLSGDQPVPIDDISGDVAYDGAAFTQGWKAVVR